MSSIIDLLEAKREVLSETQTAFAKRIGIVDSSIYAGVKTGRLKFPKALFPKIAKLLQMTEKQLRAFPHSSAALSEIEVSHTDLEYLSGIAKAAGRALPLKFLIEHLRLKNGK